MNLSFAGCGFLGIYHVGVAVCFKKYAPHLLLDKISGASAGAIAACCLLCDLPIAEMATNLLRLAREARQRALGPFSPSFNVQEVLIDSLQKFLPDDAHLRVSGKLHISLTRVYDGKNVIVSQYNSREDLLQALLASSFIPLFSGFLPPRFHGIRYMDGGFSDNLPTLDENTITISPFCGESDICPRDISSQLFHVNLANTSIELSKQNMYRCARILFPPNPEILSNMCKQGFDDALRFLNRNNLINCNRCLAVQSTFVVSETLEDNSTEYDPDCVECKMHRQEALVANLPETVMMIFQDAIDSANKGFINWLFKHRSVKLLSLLSLPYILPVDVVYATFTKFIVHVPKLQKGIIEMSRYFLEQLSLIFPKVNVYYEPIPQTIKCHVNIMEYESRSADDSIRKQQKANLNLTLEYNDVESWQDHKHKQSTNCVIDMSNLGTTESAFENILQASANQEAVMSYYYMEDSNNKVHITEIFDVDDKTLAKEESLTSVKFDNYKDSMWMIREDDENLSRINWDKSGEFSTQHDIRKSNNTVFPERQNEWKNNLSLTIRTASTSSNLKH